MKHLIYYMLLITGAVFTVACSSDDNYDEYVNNTSSVTIVKSDVIFDANANTGTVVYEAPGVVEAVSSTHWMTASVSGNTVTVNVEPNGSSEGRAALLTLKYGNDVARVTVQQTGVSFKYAIEGGIICGDTAAVRTYPITLAGGATFWSDGDWVSASATSTELTVRIAENPTGVRRSTWLHFKAGVTEDSIFVEQHDFDKRILGNIRLYYYSSSKWSYVTMNMAKDNNKQYYLEFTGNNATKFAGFKIPVSVNPETFRVGIFAGQYVGEYSEQDVYTVFLGTRPGSTSAYRSYDPAVGMAADVVIDMEAGTYTWELDDFGSWVTSDYVYTVYSMRLGGFVEGAYASAIVSFPYPTLVKTLE